MIVADSCSRDLRLGTKWHRAAAKQAGADYIGLPSFLNQTAGPGGTMEPMAVWQLWQFPHSLHANLN